MKKVTTEIRSLYDETSGERRVQILFDKLVKEILDESKLENELLVSRQTYENSLQEQEKLKDDNLHEKTAKQKLESYYNSLRKEHAKIIEDANKLSDDDKQKRIEISTNYQRELTINSKTLEEVCYQRAEYAKYNELLKEKMKELMGFVEERDKTFNDMLEEKTKELEEYKSKMDVKPNEEEVKMREELEEYKKKFEDFQSLLTESNHHFTHFKKEMEANTKVFKALQKDNMELKKKEVEFQDSLKVLREEVDHLKKSKNKLENDINKLGDLKAKLSSQGS